MSTVLHSLLDDSLIRVRFSDGRVHACTLPEVLAALVAEDVYAFEALQPHQQQPWHSFLVQLAAMAVARETSGQVPEDADTWRSALLALADGNAAAWHLIVDDVSQPAFMQPPIPEGSLDEANYKADIPTPDQLDILITSKNHDVKAQRIARPQPEHWLYALLTLQTMEGFLGRGNYGVVRMNGGFGNRPQVGYTHKLSWGTRFRRDVDVLLAERQALLGEYEDDGPALLWTLPWDGGKTSGIPLSSCDPYFIEVCRRIRFTEPEGATESEGVLICWRANTKAQRVDAPDSLKGVTGDPWTPVEKKGAKALTVGESGFRYDLLQELLQEGDYRSPAAMRPQESDQGGTHLVVRTLVRGQGKTDGLHRRIVPIPGKASARLFGSPSEQERLGNRARMRVTLASEVQRKVLYPAIAALLSGGRDDKVDWERVRPWTSAFDRAVDARFFEALWDSVELDENEARRQWQKILLGEAKRQFEDAEGSTPISAIHRWHARSKAHAVFYGSARRTLELAFD